MDKDEKHMLALLIWVVLSLPTGIYVLKFMSETLTFFDKILLPFLSITSHYATARAIVFLLSKQKRKFPKYKMGLWNGEPAILWKEYKFQRKWKKYKTYFSQEMLISKFNELKEKQEKEKKEYKPEVTIFDDL